MNQQSTVLTFNPVLALKLDTDAAVILQQIKYWLSKKCAKKIVNSTGKWIYNSLNAWKEQFPHMSEYKIRKSIKCLETLGLVKSKKVNSKKWNHTKWYSIDFEKYDLLLKEPAAKKQEIENAGKNINKNLSEKKSSDRSDENQQIINIQKTNYTNNKNSLSLYPSLSSEKPIEKIEEEKGEEKMKKAKKEKILKQEQSYTKKQILEAQNVANNMTECWNKVFANSQNKIKAYSNKNLIFKLQNLYETKFKQDLKGWKLYAQKVASSKFLMGEKKDTFKASFAWLLKDEIVDAILNGAYGVGDRNTKAVVDTNIQEMVEIWKSNIGFKNKSFELTKSRIKKLNNVFKNHFNSEIGKWKEFVEDMKKSTFLRGESKSGFKACLDWIMKEEILLKANKGEYHTKNEWNEIVDRRHREQKLDDLKNNVELDSRWKNTLLGIVEQIGENTYISWFSKVKFESSDEGILVLKMPTDMHKQHIEKYYSKKLFEIAASHFGAIKEIWFLFPKETLDKCHRQCKIPIVRR